MSNNMSPPLFWHWQADLTEPSWPEDSDDDDDVDKDDCSRFTWVLEQGLLSRRDLQANKYHFSSLYCHRNKKLLFPSWDFSLTCINITTWHQDMFLFLVTFNSSNSGKSKCHHSDKQDLRKCIISMHAYIVLIANIVVSHLVTRWCSCTRLVKQVILSSGWIVLFVFLCLKIWKGHSTEYSGIKLCNWDDSLHSEDRVKLSILRKLVFMRREPF